MGGQTEAQVAESRKLRASTETCDEFVSTYMSSTKVNASGWPNETQVSRTQVDLRGLRRLARLASTCEACVDLRVWLASALEDNSQIDFLEDNIQVK